MRRPGRLLSVGIAGALGGGVNATLCYLELPVAVQESAAKFQWHIVPAGAFHGGLLALVAFGAALLTTRLSKPLQSLVALTAGWLGGYVSWIPLHLSVTKSATEAFTWPAQESTLLEMAWIPFHYFGGVATFVYLWLLKKWALVGGPWAQMLAVSAAATLGSLWWWIEWGPWYFSLLHGTIWGALVGLAASYQEDRAAGQIR